MEFLGGSAAHVSCQLTLLLLLLPQEGRQYLSQLNSSIGRDAMLLREAAQAIEEVRVCTVHKMGLAEVGTAWSS